MGEHSLEYYIAICLCYPELFCALAVFARDLVHDGLPLSFKLFFFVLESVMCFLHTRVIFLVSFIFFLHQFLFLYFPALLPIFNLNKVTDSRKQLMIKSARTYNVVFRTKRLNLTISDNVTATPTNIYSLKWYELFFSKFS